ncbi:MAG TPA: hypothetical protein VFM88_19550 [Vicinamibacteria bacterium]|nr:hypothetical protein [Vicinamibacteria bacterium]
MRKPCAMLALISMLFAVPIVSADDHLVSRGAADQRLAGAAAERARNIASLDALLASPGAGKAAAVAGLDRDRARRELPRLSDGELSDLARRAAALGSDPAAGYHGDAAGALVLVMVFSAMALVILAVADHY